MVIDYLSKNPESVSLLDFAQNYQIPMSYIRRINLTNQSPRVQHAFALLFSGDEIRLSKINENSNKMAAISGAQFALRARHNVGTKGNNENIAGTASVKINYGKLSEELFNKINKENLKKKVINLEKKEDK